MFTLPVTTTGPEVPMSAPPLSVRLPFTVREFVPVLREPALTMRLVAVSWDCALSVPVTDRAAKDAPAPRATVFEAPEKVIVEEVAVKLTADAVSHDPAALTVAEAMATVAAPEEVRLPAKEGEEEVRVRVPENVRLPVNVVEMPLFTVRLSTVWGRLTVPPDAFTTTVEVPAVKDPALMSTDRTVIVDPFAARAPPAATVNVTAATERLDAEVDKVVVPVPPCTVRTLATRRPFVARVYVAAFGPLLNVRL